MKCTQCSICIVLVLLGAAPIHADIDPWADLTLGQGFSPIFQKVDLGYLSQLVWEDSILFADGFGPDLGASLLPDIQPVYTPWGIIVAPAEEVEEEPLAGDTFVILGTIRYMRFEGGFYAIQGTDGNNYDPINLPNTYAVDGLRVRVVARAQPLMGSFHMYGQIIEIVDIRPR